MILDTSAIIAIIKAEPGHQALLTTITNTTPRRISAGTWLELMIVAQNKLTPREVGLLDQLLQRWDVQIESVTGEQARIASHAYRDFGKGTGNAAGLNFGDCFSYALARSTQEPLLFVGDDFSRTDIARAAPADE